VEKEITFNRLDACPSCNGSGARRKMTCPRCNGAGSHVQQHGAFMMKQSCSGCRGSGQVPAETCEACLGTSVTPPKSVKKKVTIPKGVRTGMQLCFEKEGEHRPGARPGHLYVVVVIEDHPVFHIVEDDLVCKYPMNYGTLVLGGEILVPTLDSTMKVNVPAGTSATAKFRLLGMGLPIMNTDQVGDIIVSIDLEIPKELNEDYRQVLEGLKLREEQYKGPKYTAFRENVAKAAQ
jgi:molecular chaperone DnaJ